MNRGDLSITFEIVDVEREDTGHPVNEHSRHEPSVVNVDPDDPIRTHELFPRLVDGGGIEMYSNSQDS
jgi:hypothetical protein